MDKEQTDYINLRAKAGQCDKHEGVYIRFESLECPLCRFENIEKELDEAKQELVNADEWNADLEAQLGASLRH